MTQAHQRLRSTLDLHDYSPRDVNSLPPRTAALLDSHVKEVRLPAGMPEMPQWVTDLSHLEKLDAPGFQGDRLTLKSTALAEVNVPPGTLVENRVRAAVKTLVNHIENGEVVGRGTAVGQIYNAQRDLEKRSVNLNGIVKFADSPDEQTIHCRHIAMRELLDAQKLDAGKKVLRHPASSAKLPSRVQQREQQMGAPSLMQRHISYVMEARLNELVTNATDQIPISHDRWGDMMAEQFLAMGGEGGVHMIVSTGSHAMALSLKAKPMDRRPQEGLSYGVKFYDPNSTLDHLRLVEAELGEIRNLKMSDFVQDLTHYEAHPSLPEAVPGAVTLFTKLPDGAYEKKRGEPLIEKGAPQVAAKHYVNEQDAAAPILVKFLSYSKGSVEEAQKIGLRIADSLMASVQAQAPEKRAAYLQKQCNLLLAYRRGADDFGDLKRVLKDLSQSGQIGSGQLKDVLLGLAYPNGMLLAQSYGDPPEMVDAYRGLIDAAGLDRAASKALGNDLWKRSHEKRNGHWIPNPKFAKAWVNNRGTAEAYRDLMLDLIRGPAASDDGYASSASSDGASPPRTP